MSVLKKKVLKRAAQTALATLKLKTMSQMPQMPIKNKHFF
jgi:hypothetical protein